MLERSETEAETEANDGHNQPDRQSAALVAAEKGVNEAHEGKKLDSVLESIDFSKDKFNFSIADTYHGQARTGIHNTRTEGTSRPSPHYFDDKPGAQNKWGNPRNEAHNSSKPVEQVGIRESASQVWAQTEQVVRARGLKGMLGFKSTRMVSELKNVEPTYTFDYEFAAPAVKRDGTSQAALDAGNRAGQNIRLSLEISKEQAEALSEIIAKDPTAARAVLDKYVEATGDKGKWNAEIFKEDGTFEDPGERYGVDGFAARDVRPRYTAVPDLKPAIIGLIGRPEPAAADEKAQAEADLARKVA